MNDLTNKFLHGLKWTASARFASQLVTWGITLYVMRLLDPQDYGTFAIIVTVTSLIAQFSEFGISQAVIQNKSAQREDYGPVFFILLILNGLFLVILMLGSQEIAEFFEQPQLRELIWIAALSIPVGLLSIIPTALIEKRLAFKTISLIELAAAITTSALTLSLAILDYGVYALVFGYLASVTIKTLAVNIIEPFAMIRLTQTYHSKALFRYGSKITLQNILWRANDDKDVFFLGKILDANAVGLFTTAKFLPSLVLQKTIPLVNKVSFPVYSNANTVRDASEFYIRSLTIFSIFSFPLLWGLAATSTELVPVLLGEKWKQVGPILGVIALSLPFRSMTLLLNPLLNGIGVPARGIRNSATVTISSSFFMILGLICYDFIGATIGWTLGLLLSVVINVLQSLTSTQITLREITTTITEPMICATVMVGAIFASKSFTTGLSVELQLAIHITLGVIIYTVLILKISEKARGVRDFILAKKPLVC